MSKYIFGLFGAIILILLGCIAYQQYIFYQKLSKVQNELIESRQDFSKYKEIQTKNLLNAISEINAHNFDKIGELNEKLDKINSISNDNRVIIDRLRETSERGKNSFSNYSDTTKQRYLETITELFRESTELL